MASDLLLFYTQEFAYVALAADVTTGSSIMPQKRNPDVLELLRAASATAHACLDESLMITAKLQSGYQRDLQRLKAPLFRGIDLAVDSVDIMAYLLDGLRFLPDNIELDEGILRPRRPIGWSMKRAYPFALPINESPNAIQSKASRSIIDRSPQPVDSHEIHYLHISDDAACGSPCRLWPKRAAVRPGRPEFDSDGA